MNRKATTKATNRRVSPSGKRKPESPLVWLGLTRSSTVNMIVLILVVLGSGLSLVNMTHQNRFLFNELQQSRNQANELEVQWGQLLIEQSTFGLGAWVETKAMEELKLHVPEIDKIIMVTND
jgi:cell division protein FtsL